MVYQRKYLEGGGLVVSWEGRGGRSYLACADFVKGYESECLG